MKIGILIAIIVALVIADKILTITNVSIVKKNIPNCSTANALSIERNPIQKWLMEKTGLYIGNVIGAIISLITIFIAFLLLRKVFGESGAIYLILIVYGLTITNNLYWLLKYARVL